MENKEKIKKTKDQSTMEHENNRKRGSGLKNWNWRGWLNNRAKESWLEFVLVRTMLFSLIFLVALLIIMPFLFKYYLDVDHTEIIDYSKWVLTALLAAFGAWIGAGSAYFFGKENLIASNKSTQEALKLQIDSSKVRSLVMDIHPMDLNPSFQFNLDSDVEEVLKKLEENVDYWFVPIIENGRLKDTVHTEAFWRYRQINKEGKVKDVIKYIEEEDSLQQKRTKLHGFFVKVKMDDVVHEVAEKMNKNHATVGIVCDNEDKPTHCLSINDLRSFRLGSS